MLQLPLIGRPCLMSEFCFAVQDIEWPVEPRRTTADGIPEYLWINLKRWKGNREGHKTQRIRLYRNTGSAQYCPVAALLNWLALSGITSGPVFPALSHSRDAVKP